MIKKFAQHWPVVVIAITLGLISSLPQFYVTKEIEGFQGIYRGAMDDQLYYEARAKDVLEGHTYLSNPYLYEHKDGFPMQFWLPDFLLSKSLSLLNLSVPIGYIVWTGIIVAFLFVLSYAVFWLLTYSGVLSLACALFLHGYMFVLLFIRLPSPSFNFIFWLLTSLFLILYLKNGGFWYALASTLSFGFLFHLYPYFWTFYATLLVMFMVFSLILRSGIIIKPYFYILVGGFLVGLPYFVFLLFASKLTVYGESLRRLGMIDSHFPSGLVHVILAGILIFVYVLFYYKGLLKKDKVSILLFSGLIASIAVVNQHIITGKNLEFSSHYFLGNFFWCIFSASYLLSQILEKYPLKIRQIFMRSVLGASLIFLVPGLHSLIQIQTVYSQSEINAQRYAAVLEWLNSYALPESVVFTDDEIGYYLPVYTSQNVYSSPFGILFFMSDREARERFIINHYFDEFSYDFVVKNQRMVFGGYYVNEFGHGKSVDKVRLIFGMSVPERKLVPDKVVSDFISEAKSIQEELFSEVVRKYRIDYILWDSISHPNWMGGIKKLEKDGFVSNLFSENGIYLYEIK